jgi:hypothetical protein
LFTKHKDTGFWWGNIRERDDLEDPGVDGRTILRYTGFWWRNMRERYHLEDPGVDGRMILRDTGFWWGNMTEIDHLEDPGVDVRTILRWIFRKWDVGAWNGSMWLRTETGGGQL